MLFSLISAKWIYGPVLPAEVYADVKARLAVGEKIHQHLKPDALKLVENQIVAVTSIANGCPNCFKAVGSFFDDFTYHCESCGWSSSFLGCNK